MSVKRPTVPPTERVEDVAGAKGGMRKWDFLQACIRASDPQIFRINNFNTLTVYHATTNTVQIAQEQEEKIAKDIPQVWKEK